MIAGHLGQAWIALSGCTKTWLVHMSKVCQFTGLEGACWFGLNASLWQTKAHVYRDMSQSCLIWVNVIHASKSSACGSLSKLAVEVRLTLHPDF